MTDRKKRLIAAATIAIAVIAVAWWLAWFVNLSGGLR